MPDMNPQRALTRSVAIIATLAVCAIGAVAGALPASAHPTPAAAGSTPGTTQRGVGDMGAMDSMGGTGHGMGDMGFPPLATRLAHASTKQRHAASTLLTRLRTQLAPYEDEDAARADGFVPNDTTKRLIHYRNVANRRDDRELDPTHLEGLVYAHGADGRLHLLGALFTVRPGEVAPTPAGDIFRWHTHDPSCADFLVHPGECRDTFRMLHVWTTKAIPIRDPWQQHFRDAVDRHRMR